MPPNLANQAVSRQFEVIKCASESLARMIQTHVSEAMGRKVKVTHETTPEARKKHDVSVTLVELKQGIDTLKREYERHGADEQFRAPPIKFSVKFLVSAWATPPEDQAILGAVMRTFLDHPALEFSQEDEMVLAYDQGAPPSLELGFLDLDEHTRLLAAYQMPMAPAVTYTLHLRVRSTRVRSISRVRERVIDFRNINS